MRPHLRPVPALAALSCRLRRLDPQRRSAGPNRRHDDGDYTAGPPHPDLDLRRRLDAGSPDRHARQHQGQRLHRCGAGPPRTHPCRRLGELPAAGSADALSGGLRECDAPGGKQHAGAVGVLPVPAQFPHSGASGVWCTGGVHRWAVGHDRAPSTRQPQGQGGAVPGRSRWQRPPGARYNPGRPARTHRRHHDHQRRSGDRLVRAGPPNAAARGSGYRRSASRNHPAADHHPADRLGGQALRPAAGWAQAGRRRTAPPRRDRVPGERISAQRTWSRYWKAPIPPARGICRARRPQRCRSASCRRWSTIRSEPTTR